MGLGEGTQARIAGMIVLEKTGWIHMGWRVLKGLRVDVEMLVTCPDLFLTRIIFLTRRTWVGLPESRKHYEG